MRETWKTRVTSALLLRMQRREGERLSVGLHDRKCVGPGRVSEKRGTLVNSWMYTFSTHKTKQGQKFTSQYQSTRL